MRFSFLFYNRLIEKHKDAYDKQKVVELTDKLKKRNSDKQIIIRELKALLECDDTESSELYYNYVSEMYEWECAQTNIEYLLKISVSRNAIKKHGSLLTLPFGKFLVASPNPKKMNVVIKIFLTLICRSNPEKCKNYNGNDAKTN